MLDTLASSSLGQQARMTEFERMLIEPPLIRLLTEHSAVATAMAAWSDGVSLLIGLGMYGARLSQLAKERHAASAPEPAPAPTNGAADVAGVPMTPDLLERLIGGAQA